MSQLNRPFVSRTHEGAPTTNPLTPIQQLRRTLLTCMLWEDNFYESGVSVADRIRTLVPLCDVQEVAALAIEARSVHHLRHVPLLLLREMVRSAKGRVVGDTIAQVIQRPDEITEFLALYWGDSKKPNGKRAMLSKQVRLGLARAFRKFDAYQLAKYNRDNPIKLRDALFMVHGKPRDGRVGYNRNVRKYGTDLPQLSEGEALYRMLVDDTLPVPDTWETKLSAGVDKGATFESLLREKKLGYMALLRNLRNMEESGVPADLICEALESGAAKSKALPFRYIAAYRNVKHPDIKGSLNTAMLTAITGLKGLPGKTLVLVDVSGSMDAKLSGKSDLSRVDAAAALAVYLRGVCESSSVVTFSNNIKMLGGTQGIDLVEEIIYSQSHGGTMLGHAIMSVAGSGYDRIVVITDEQSADRVGPPVAGKKGYMINVAPYRNGVGYDTGWIKIDGFSEQVVNYIQALEMDDGAAVA